VRTQFETLSISARVDRQYGVVLGAETTLATANARAYIDDLLTGVCLSGPVEPVLKTLRETYWGGAKKALDAAIRDLFKKWQQIGGEAEGQRE